VSASRLPGRLCGLNVVPARTLARACTALGRMGDLCRIPKDLRGILDGRHHNFHTSHHLSFEKVFKELYGKNK